MALLLWKTWSSSSSFMQLSMVKLKSRDTLPIGFPFVSMICMEFLCRTYHSQMERGFINVQLVTAEDGLRGRAVVDVSVSTTKIRAFFRWLVGTSTESGWHWRQWNLFWLFITRVFQLHLLYHLNPLPPSCAPRFWFRFDGEISRLSSFP